MISVLISLGLSPGVREEGGAVSMVMVACDGRQSAQVLQLEDFVLDGPSCCSPETKMMGLSREEILENV